MAFNIEIKARLHSPAAQFDLAKDIAGCDSTILKQRDTFFHCAHGRLKLREVEGETAHLIQYFRSDDPTLRKSDYIISSVPDPDSMSTALERSNGLRGIVSKTRNLWIVGQTRIHFDAVEGLGDFVELEFVLQPNQNESEGQQFAADLIRRLDIRDEDVIECAYIDLLENLAIAPIQQT